MGKRNGRLGENERWFTPVTLRNSALGRKCTSGRFYKKMRAEMKRGEAGETQDKRGKLTVQTEDKVICRGG